MEYKLDWEWCLEKKRKFCPENFPTLKYVSRAMNDSETRMTKKLLYYFYG